MTSTELPSGGAKIPNAEDIVRLLQSRSDVLKQYAVKRIGLFGSFATGTAGPDSDVDFVVEFDEPTFENYIGRQHLDAGRHR